MLESVLMEFVMLNLSLMENVSTTANLVMNIFNWIMAGKIVLVMYLDRPNGRP